MESRILKGKLVEGRVGQRRVWPGPGKAARPLGLRPGPSGWPPPAWLPPTGPRHDTRTIVWICLTLIAGLVVLLLLLICKKRWVVLAPSHPKPLPRSTVSPACPRPR